MDREIEAVRGNGGIGSRASRGAAVTSRTWDDQNGNQPARLIEADETRFAPGLEFGGVRIKEKGAASDGVVAFAQFVVLHEDVIGFDRLKQLQAGIGSRFAMSDQFTLLPQRVGEGITFASGRPRGQQGDEQRGNESPQDKAAGLHEERVVAPTKESSAKRGSQNVAHET